MHNQQEASEPSGAGWMYAYTWDQGEPDGPSLPVSESLKPRLTLKLKLDKNK